ncbi:HIT domain-containing protein [Patescibacteria group bacterium]|nr:HIT domain-containing protein [Patescibacteria group bacterium]
MNKDLILLESKYSVLLANYFPLSDFNMMVIPKRHVYSITDLSVEESTDIMGIITMAVNNIKTLVKPEGINVFLNEGEIAGQTVPHLHFHIVARNSNDVLENFKRNGEKDLITTDQLKLIKSLF